MLSEEPSEEIKSSIIKLFRLLSFYFELKKQKENLARYCKVDIWPNDKTAYTIHVNEFDFYREGSDSTTGFCGSEPLTYEELIRIVLKYDNPCKNLDALQNFIEKFFSFGDSIPASWLSKVNEIIEKPISNEEYADINKIIDDNKKRTALGWLDKVREFSDSRLYYRPTAESYINKAREIWPQVDVSEAEQIIKNKETDGDLIMIDKKIKEINELYETATPESYLEAIEKGIELEALSPKGKFYEFAPKMINSYWANYYLTLKYAETVRYGKDYLIEKIKDIISHLSEPTEIFSFLYLWSVAESSLQPYDFEEACRLNLLMDEMIKKGKVGLIEIFRFINARGLKLYAEKDFTEAVRAFSEIKMYPTDPKNMDDETKQIAGHVFNNWGMVLVRGDINPQEGETLLIKARDEYYMNIKTPPEVHLGGIKNRLREAEEKKLQKK